MEEEIYFEEDQASDENWVQQKNYVVVDISGLADILVWVSLHGE